jgi:hypothetical protein
MTFPLSTTLTCTNDDCPCRLAVEVPCPHGDDFRCGCGHAMVPVEGDDAPIVTPGA